MNIQKMRPEQLLPAEYNPRKDLRPGDAEYEKLKRSIETYGYTVPIIWNKTTGNVAGGHQRLTVLKELGYEEIDCVVVELSLENEKALNVALNKISGEWDDDKLSELISELSVTDLDVTVTGFDPPDIETMIRGSRLRQLQEDTFDIDGELNKPVVCRSGDLWLLGQHRLLCGNGAKQYAVDFLMDGIQANMLLAAVPHGVSGGEILNTLTNAAKVMTDDASVYLIHEDEDSLMCRQAYGSAGFYLSGTCVWERETTKTASKKSTYNVCHAPVLFGWKVGGRHQWYADRKQVSVWEIPTADGKDYPIALMGYPILNSSLTNGVVFAPFGGYGATLIACEQTGRICRMTEQDEKNCDVIIQRYIGQTGNASAVFVIRDGDTTPYSEVTV